MKHLTSRHGVRAAASFARPGLPRGATPVVLAVFLLAASAVLLSRCTGCRDTVVDHQSVGKLVVSVQHRVCGSASGYTVSVTPPDLDTTGRADEFEPFSLRCDCFEPSSSPPVTIRVIDSTTVEIRYDPRLRVEKMRSRHGQIVLRYVSAAAQSAIPPR